MKVIFFNLLLVALPCLLVAQSVDSHSLEGTWKLTKAKWGDMENHKVPEREIYKIFTTDHFFFVYYDNEKFSGAGGGTYVANNNTFTETLAYYSWDSTAVGTQQTFTWTLDGNTLHQEGLIKGADQYDNYVIDEYYEKVENGISQTKTNPLLGVWLYKDGEGDTADYRTANNIKSYKVITPQFFYIAFIDKDTGAFDGAGFGTYTYDNGKYSETIKAFSFDPSAVGKTFHFDIEAQPDQFLQIGELDTDNYEDFSVRERYVRVE